MKKILQFSALFLVANSLTIFISCNKDNDEPRGKTKTELLTAGNWILTAAIINPAYDYYVNVNPVTDIFAILEPCEKDDFETYKTNGTWEYNEGLTKCDPSSPQIFSEPWSFTANETKLFVGPVECTILDLTETSLKLRYSFEDSGVIYTEEDTYKH